MGLRPILAFLSAIAVMAVVTSTLEDTTRRVLDALADAPFEEWSPIFIATNDKIRGEVLRSTLFIPDSSANSYGKEDRRMLAAYHIVSEKLQFFDLLSKSSQSRLPTILTDYSVLVTNNSDSGFTIDGVLITEPDIFVDAYIAVHRIASPLDYKKFGHRE